MMSKCSRTQGQEHGAKQGKNGVQNFQQRETELIKGHRNTGENNTLQPQKFRMTEENRKSNNIKQKVNSKYGQ